MARVLIADDHPLVLRGIRETLKSADDIIIIGEAMEGNEVQRLSAELLPDVLLLDLQMPGPTAIETVRFLHAQCPTTRVIILTAYDDAVYIHRMIAAGVSGYVVKGEVTDVLATAVRSVMQGGSWLSHHVLEIAIAEGNAAKINERERVILQMLAEGMTLEHIASIENMSVRTVKRSVAALESKLDAPCQFVLGLKAARHRLID